MEESDIPDKSMRRRANQMYFRQHGTNTAAPHEYTRDPPPYEGPSIRQASFLPEAPSPAPITGTGVVMEPGVVMGDFLDDRIDERIDELYTRIRRLENIVDKCCDDDEFEDVQEEEPIIQTQNGDYFTDEEFLRALRVFYDKEKGAKKLVSIMKGAYPNKLGINAKRVRDTLQLIRSGKTPEVTTKSAKKFDYKTKGFITIKKADAYPGDNPGFTSNELSKLKKYVIKENYPGIVWCPDQKWGSVRTQANSYEELFSNIVVAGEGKPKGYWICETIITPGCPLKLIKEKMDQGYEIEFEDENDEREVKAMQGGGYRRRNTRRKSRKRNTRRKSRKRNTLRKSRKRSSRRKSKRKHTRQKGGGITPREIKDKKNQLRKIGEIGRYSYGPEIERLSHLQSFDDRINFRSHDNLIRRINDCEGSKKEVISELENLKKSIVGAHYI